MECNQHPGQTADLTCLQCGTQFCRTCLAETNDPNYCPECHRERVTRFASQMGVKPARGRAKKTANEPRGKRGATAPVPPIEPRVQPPMPQAPIAGHPDMAAPPSPAGAPDTRPSVEQFTVAPPQAPPARMAPPPPAAPAPPAREESPFAVGLTGTMAPFDAPPPAPTAPPVAPTAPPVAPAGLPNIDTAQPQIAQTRARVEPPGPAPAAPVPPTAVPVQAAGITGSVAATAQQMAAPVGGSGKEVKKLRKPAKSGTKARAATAPPGDGPLDSDEGDSFWGEIEGSRKSRRRARGAAPAPILAASADEQVIGRTAEPVAQTVAQPEAERALPPDDSHIRDEYAPRLGRLRKEKKEKGAARKPVALQYPEEYDGAVTVQPSYFKAVFFALLTGIILAGAYAGFEWWRHSGRWIFGWVIGFAVGIVVVFASGRHFNWKLGVISTVIACGCLCLGQLAFSILDVRFNGILPLKLPFMTLLNQAAHELLRSFGTAWLALFIITGVVAFLVSFRPWPVRFQISADSGAGRAGPGQAKPRQA